MGGTEARKKSRRRFKVVRLIDKYNLDEIGEQLEYFWTTDGDDRKSLRDLADYFNQQLLTAAVTDVGMQPLLGEMENMFRLLTADEIGAADKTRVRRRLEREGIDVGQLESDFVTYQAIRTYLKDHRGAEHTTDDRPRVDVETDNLQSIRGRIVAVTENKLEQLVDGDHVTLGEHRVLAEINVLCEDCGRQYDVIDLLNQEGCACDERAD